MFIHALIRSIKSKMQKKKKKKKEIANKEILVRGEIGYNISFISGLICIIYLTT